MVLQISCQVIVVMSILQFSPNYTALFLTPLIYKRSSPNYQQDGWMDSCPAHLRLRKWPGKSHINGDHNETALCLLSSVHLINYEISLPHTHTTPNALLSFHRNDKAIMSKLTNDVINCGDVWRQRLYLSLSA